MGWIFYKGPNGIPRPRISPYSITARRFRENYWLSIIVGFPRRERRKAVSELIFFQEYTVNDAIDDANEPRHGSHGALEQYKIQKMRNILNQLTFPFINQFSLKDRKSTGSLPPPNIKKFNYTE